MVQFDFFFSQRNWKQLWEKAQFDPLFFGKAGKEAR